MSPHLKLQLAKLEMEGENISKMPPTVPSRQPDIPIDSDITMPDLNDDYLRESFDYASAFDLISLAVVYSRFKRIAQEKFAAKYKRFHFDTLQVVHAEHQHTVNVVNHSWGDANIAES